MKISQFKVNGGSPKLLVTGASGMLGHAICAQALSQWSVVATYRNNRPQLSSVTPVQIDLTDLAALRRLVADLKPAAIIHAAAAAQIGACEAHPRNTASINVMVPAVLADLCAEKSILYTFISTDLVFNGRQAPYREQDAVDPVCVYGEQKVLAERAVLQNDPQALVCRLPLMFGLGPYAEGHFIMQTLKAMRQGRTVQLFIDEYRTPVDNISAARGLLHLIGRAEGLLHLGGGTRISRHDLGQLMAFHLGVGPERIRAVTLDELKLPVARAPDCSLDSRQANGLGYNPTPLASAVKAVVRRFEFISAG